MTNIKTSAIIVLGGGIQDSGELPDPVVRRLNTARLLFESGRYGKIIVSGKGCDSFSIVEADAMNDYLIERGISSNHILNEPLSLDTIQNAYYSRILHVEPGHFSSATIITNRFHLKRVKVIFDWVIGSICNLTYQAAPDQDDVNSKFRDYAENEQMKFCREFFSSTREGNLSFIHDFIHNENNLFKKEYRALSYRLKKIRFLQACQTA